VRRTGGAGDLGVDIACYDEHGGLVAVQCKRYAPGNKVTSPNIAQFFGMMVHHGARHGMYVTTSSFTRAGLQLATTRDIRTMDGAQLAAHFAAHPEVLGIPKPDPPQPPIEIDRTGKQRPGRRRGRTAPNTDQKAAIEPIGRGFWGTIGWLLKWVIIAIVVLAILSAVL
jgi:hypothetical protein